MRFTKVIWLSGVLTSIAVPADGQPPSERWMTATQILRDVDLAQEAYQRVHPGYTRYTTAEALATAWHELRLTAIEAGGMTVGDFYLAIERTLVEIRCDHTKAELPRDLRRARAVERVYLPFRWKLVQGRAFIDRAAEPTGLVFGDELLEIDGRPIAQVIETVSGYIPVDGYTSWARQGEVAASLELPGGAVDHFGALVWKPKPIATLKIRSETAGPRTVLVERINFDEWTALAEKQAVNFKDAVRFRRVGKAVGVLSIDTFVNYRQPVDPDDLLQPIFTAMNAEGRTTLILDLRRNGGGSNAPQRALLGYLISRPQRLYTAMTVATIDLDGLRPHLWTWDQRALRPDPSAFRRHDDGTYALRASVDEDLRPMSRRREAFEGQLIVLIGPHNSSGTTVLAAFLKAQRGAVLVGERTGGSPDGPTAGLLFTLTLPRSGIRTRLPFVRYHTNISPRESGYGLRPDVTAPLTVSDFLRRRDPALAVALAAAENGRRTKNPERHTR